GHRFGADLLGLLDQLGVDVVGGEDRPLGGEGGVGLALGAAGDLLRLLQRPLDGLAAAVDLLDVAPGDLLGEGGVGHRGGARAVGQPGDAEDDQVGGAEDEEEAEPARPGRAVAAVPAGLREPFGAPGAAVPGGPRPVPAALLAVVGAVPVAALLFGHASPRLRLRCSRYAAGRPGVP